MPTLTIRNLSDALYSCLRERAKKNRRSVSQEAAYILERALAEPATQEFWRQVDRVREIVRSRYGTFPDSSALVREDRGR